MKEFSYIITDPEGIHARPAGLLVKEAGKFSCKVVIKKEEKEADAKRIFGVMGLAAKQGDKVILEADGVDEDKAIEVLEKFIKENL